MGNKMIEVKNLSYSIGNKKILKSISIDLPKNNTIALIGPNGAGKSSLLKLMGRSIKIQSGYIAFDGMDINKKDSIDIAKKISLLQQDTHINIRISVIDLLFFARYPYHRGHPKEEDKSHIQSVIEYFSLEPFKDRFIDEMSGGQQQLVLIAMVFCQGTDYILLDEPLNNLDMARSKSLMTTLTKAISDWGKSIVVVMHDINYASRFANYIIGLKAGEIVFSGKNKDVLTKNNIENLYDINVQIVHKNEHVYFFPE